jgi:hypothetical protein
MMNRDHLSIAVKSPAVVANDLIGRIIKDALKGGGFKSVEVYDQKGDPVPPKPLVTMLDAVRSLSPKTFQTRVAIRTKDEDHTELTFTEQLQGVELETGETVEQD